MISYDKLYVILLLNMTYMFYVTQLIDSYKSFWNDSYDTFTSFTVCHSCLEGVLISPVEEIPQEEVTNLGHRRYPTDQNRGAMARNQKSSFYICLYDQNISNPQSISVLFDPFDDLHLMM